MLAKHADATVNDIVLAMSAGTQRTYLHARDALPVAVDRDGPGLAAPERHSPDDSGPGGAGNRVGVLMCNLTTHLPDAGHRLAAVRDCIRECKAALRAR